MEKYIIVLGSNWKLALAELEQLLRLKEYKGYVTDYSANCAIVEFDESQLGSDVDPLEMIGNLMVRLGCSQKIAKMIDFIDITLLNDAFPAEITMDNRTEVFTGRDYISGMLDDLIFNLFGDKDEMRKLMFAE